MTKVHKKQHPLTPSWDLTPRSFQLFKTHFVALLYLSILPALVMSLGSTLVGDSKSVTTKVATGMALMCVGVIVSLLSMGALLRLQLLATKDAEVSVPALYRTGIPYLPRLIGFAIVYAALVCMGLVLLVVPGLILLRRYYLAPYYLVDQNLSIREAMQRSAAGTKPVAGYVWGIIGVGIVFTFIGAFIGLLPSGIGVLGGVLCDCIYIFAPALRYREVAAAH